MDIPEFTVSRFKSPLFMGIEVAKTYIVDYYIFHQSISALDDSITDLYRFACWFPDCLFVLTATPSLWGWSTSSSGLSSEVFKLKASRLGTIWPNQYIIQLFFSFENGLLGLVGGSEEFPAREFGEDDVQFQFGD